MNKDILKGQWNQLKGDAKKKWGQLTDNQLKEVDGDYDKLTGKIQEAYGIARDQAEKELSEWKKSKPSPNSSGAAFK